MARLLYWSDLHTEFSAFSLPDVADIDAVLLGGDTGVRDGHLDFALKVWEKYGVPVLTIHGNHEFHGEVLEERIKRDRTRIAEWNNAGIEIHLLMGDAVVIKDTRIIGATLWTDLGLLGEQNYGVRVRVEQDVEDYRKIRVTDGEAGNRKLRSSDTIALHMTDRENIFQHLDVSFDGPSVVMSHHIPTPACMNPQSWRDPIGAAFGSNLTNRILASQADVWLYGHSHMAFDTVLDRFDGKPVRFVSNMRGYPFQHTQSESDFNPGFVVET